MPVLLTAAFRYLAIVFAAAFALGVLRVLVVAPRIGEVAAVLLEVPLVLAISWVVAGHTLRRWPGVARPGAALGMVALAFMMLMAGEALLSVLVFGVPFGAYLAAMLRPAGLIGLAGQIGFALIPRLRAGR
ncbi:hypothetical protein RNZ50_11605 [Paracoccaceae bacterium Fryx2]|nr:hypothetical protein [Paracoccaceae bacterium Fryx2]